MCSTNLVDDLDGASARRFDFKIRFDFPTDEQRLRMFTNTLAQEGANVRPVPRNIRERLARFTTIAPGDFATVVRRTRILGDTMTAELLIAGLEAEIAAKGDGGAKKIGFV